MASDTTVYLLALPLALSVFVCLLWLNDWLRRERYRYAKQIPAADIIDRASKFPMPRVIKSFVESDPHTARRLEREVRELAAILAINCGEQYLMPSRLLQAWNQLVSEHKEFGGFCEHLLGAGGVVIQARVSRSAISDISVARGKFADAYESTFGHKPDPTIWVDDQQITSTDNDDLIVIVGLRGRFKKVLQRDGELIDFSHGANHNR